MRQTKSIRALSLVALLVVSSIGMPLMASQPAAAAEDDYSDPLDEDAKEGACSVAGPLITYLSECNVEYGDVDGSTPEQVHYDVYSDSVFMSDARTQAIVEKKSYINQTHGIAMARAKRALITCMNEGKSQAVCEDKARDEVNEFYAEVQKSIYVSQNRQMKHWQMMEQQIHQTDNLDGTDTYPYETNPSDWETGFRQVELTLYNGETINVTKGYYKYVSGDGGDTYYVHPYHYNGQNPWSQDDFGVVVEDDGTANLNVVSPDGETTIALDGQDYKQALTTLDDRRSQSMDNVHKLANAIYDQYDPGEIEYSDTAGPLEMMITSSTDYDSTGHYSYLLQTAVQAGMAVPEDASSMVVEHDFDDDGTMETKRGVIFAPRGTFSNNTIETGVEYDPSMMNGTVNFIIADSDGQAEQVTLDTPFVVQKMEDPETGESLNKTTLQSTQFQTTDTDRLNEQINELEKKMEELEQSYDAPNSSLGGSGLPDGVNSFLQEFGMYLLIFGGIAVIVLLKW